MSDYESRKFNQVPSEILRAEPEKAKRDYEKIRDAEDELKKLSKQVVEDVGASYSAYRKRPMPPSSDAVASSDTAQLKR